MHQLMDEEPFWEGPALWGPFVHAGQRERPLGLFTDVKWGLQGARKMCPKVEGREERKRQQKRGGLRLFP